MSCPICGGPTGRWDENLVICYKCNTVTQESATFTDTGLAGVYVAIVTGVILFACVLLVAPFLFGAG